MRGILSEIEEIMISFVYLDVAENKKENLKSSTKFKYLDKKLRGLFVFLLKNKNVVQNSLNLC